MAGRISRISLTCAALATAIMPMAAQARPGWDGRHWNGGRWNDGWHRDRGVDSGDVLAGLLILGGIAAVATAASNASKNRDARADDARENGGYRYRDDDGYRNDRQGDDDGWRSSGRAGPGTRGLNEAVDSCTAEAARKGEVDEVYDATRSGSGYRVSGTLRNGDSFSCDVSAEGGVLLDIRRDHI